MTSPKPAPASVDNSVIYRLTVTLPGTTETICGFGDQLRHAYDELTDMVGPERVECRGFVNDARRRDARTTWIRSDVQSVSLEVYD